MRTAERRHKTIVWRYALLATPCNGILAAQKTERLGAGNRQIRWGLACEDPLVETGGALETTVVSGNRDITINSLWSPNRFASGDYVVPGHVMRCMGQVCRERVRSSAISLLVPRICLRLQFCKSGQPGIA